MKKKFLVVGRSASGKTSIAREACKQLGLKMVKSYTTRPPRPKELNGDSDHYFISEEDVDKYTDIVAYTEIAGNKYFATKEELDNSDVYVIDPRGVESLSTYCDNDEYKFIIVYVRTSPDVAKSRAKRRGDDDTVYSKRIIDEDAEFKQFEKDMPWQYHILNNGSFEKSVETMKKFMRTEFYIDDVNGEDKE